jgi:hypothetical protein
VTVRTRSTRLARWALLRLEDRVTPTLNVWTGSAGDGLWSSDNNWSNLHAPTSDEDAVINTTVTVTHNSGDDTVNSLAMAGNATLNLTGGSITDLVKLDAPAGDSHFNLAGGTLAGATVSAGSTVFATTSGGALTGVTLAGTLDLTTNVSTRVNGGLTLTGGTVLLGSSSGNYGVLSFDGGSQTLGGTGTVVFGTSFYDFLQAGPTAGSALTIGPNVLVRGSTGGVGYHTGWGGPTGVTFTNQGTIQADTAGGTITLDGTNWTNAGTLRAAGGTLTTAGSWTNSGTVTSAGSPSAIAAVTESGNTVTVTTAAAHGYAVGQSVVIAGVGNAGYNGTFTITGVTGLTTFTYTHFATGLPDSGGGTATLNSTVNLGGTYATATLGTVTSTGGSVNLTGTLDNTGHTLALDATTGSWQLAGVTVTGGTIATAGGAALVETTSGGTLAGVTLAGTLDIGTQNGASARVTGGLTLNGGTVLLGTPSGNYGLLSFDGGDQTLGGTGSVVFGTSIYDFLRSGPTAGSNLTIGPGVTVRGHTGSIGYSVYWGGPTDVTFTNQGTVQADTAGGTISLGGKNWSNTGTLGATSGGSLTLFSQDFGWTSSTPVSIDGGGTLIVGGTGWTTAGVILTNSTLNLGSAYNVPGTFALAGLGALTRTGGTVNVTGTLDNSNATLALDATTGPWQLSGGTILGGTVTTSGPNTLIGTTNGGKLSGVTLGGTLDLGTNSGSFATVAGGLTLDGGTVLIGTDTGNYGRLEFDGGSQTLGGTGAVVLGTNIYDIVRAGPSAGSALTIGPGVTVRGKIGGVGYSPYWGATDVSVTLQGTVHAEGDTTYGILVGNATNLAGGTLTGGTWEAVNGILRILGTPITTNAANIVLDEPTAALYSDYNAPTDALANLSANTAGGSLTVNRRVFAAAGDFANAGDLTVGPGGTFSVTHQYANSVIAATSAFGSDPNPWSAFQATGPANTFGYGDIGTAWAPQLPNSGIQSLTLGFATPDFASGVIVRETNGNGFVTQIDAIDTNNVAHTVWTGTDPSQPGTPVDFLASFPQTSYKVAAVTVYIDTDHSPTYEEVDSVQLVGPLTGYTQTSGQTRVDSGGTLTLPAGAAVDIQGGLLEGTGTIAADVTNSGTVDPGPGLGILTISGNYTQTAAGTLAIEVGGPTGGTDYDQLNLGGSVLLDGTLAVSFANSYFPPVGSSFTTLMTAAGTGGSSFAGLAEGGFLDAAGPTTFRATYAGGDGNDLALTAINRAPTLDAISDPPPTLEDPGTNTLNLTGIGSGNTDAQTLTVAAVSDNPGLIPNPTVTYTSPNATGSLDYTPAVHLNGTAHITVTVTDDGGTANGGINTFSRTFTVTVVELNDPPTLDPISDPAAIPEDSGQQTVDLTGITAGPNETQTLTVAATSSNPAVIPDPTVTYTSPNSTGSLAYTPVPNANGTAVITVTVKDDGGTLLGGVDTFTRTFTVTVTPVPDAPTLVTDPLTVLPPVPVRAKPTDEPAGMLVADLIAGKTTDADGDPVGIAITGLDPANTITKSVPKFGVWQFSTDGGIWSPIPTDVSATKALVLSADATTRIRFLPNLRFQGLSHLTFLAWDHTDGSTAGTTADSTTTPTAYSTAAERAWVAVGKSKPAVTAAGATVLAAVREDAKGSRVFTVKTLLGLAGLEALPASNLGVAITGLSTATGTWYFRLAKTKAFVQIDPAQGALLLRPIDTVQFVPTANANGTGSLQFKTWVPDANFGNYATDTTGTGFGRDSGAASISITPVNDAPVLDLNLHPVLGTAPAGQTTAPITIADLLATAPGVVTDIDSTGLGVLLMPASSKVGKWQYFDTVANAWKNLTLAKKLTADVQVRFQTATGAAAGPVSLSFKAWDGKLLSKAVGSINLTIG